MAWSTSVTSVKEKSQLAQAIFIGIFIVIAFVMLRNLMKKK